MGYVDNLSLIKKERKQVSGEKPESHQLSYMVKVYISNTRQENIVCLLL